MAVDNYLEMSDEEMMNAPAPDFVAPEVIEPEEVNEAPTEVDEPDEVDTPEEEIEESVEEVISDAKDNPEAGEAPAKAGDESVEGVEKEKVIPTEKPVEINYEAEYKKLLAPFKANGREIVPKSVDDAISLMQMGANYNKKMAALKPNLKLMKLLENNGLLDETKLSFLIDLDKKTPEAISKLVKDSGIDPMDLDLETTGNYVTKIQRVDDRELDLDSVLDDLQSTPTYNRTLQIVSKDWDAASKQAVANAPQILRVINDHVSRGIYDIIVAEMDSERMFGRLDGMSDIEAYRKVGDSIEGRGGFNHLNKTNGTAQTKAPVIVAPKPKVDTGILNDKRRAASGNKSSAPAAPEKDFNPLAMSDEEFIKLTDARFN